MPKKFSYFLAIRLVNDFLGLQAGCLIQSKLFQIGQWKLHLLSDIDQNYFLIILHDTDRFYPDRLLSTKWKESLKGITDEGILYE